ncbi:hypothetical protein OB919_16040 [Halobacteria archaeon AArc-curdl1]|uniref:Uncharacterized protein n=1 Tax=Natronosalvus hydrolyticus TaxID=2979988 RepID=A0AAP3E7C6_9EURY|nr:hypothetical protein [Halobacteria archaeon AArc-curdl1]
MDRNQLSEEWSQAYDEALNELYHEATPGIDLNEVDEPAGDDEPPLYLQHYLDADTQEEVIESVLDRYEIPEDLYFEAKKSLLLSKAPSTSLGNVERAREDYGLEPVSEMLEPGENDTL